MPGVIGGVYFLLFLIAICLVIWSCKTSEQGPEGQEIKGLFAIKTEAEKSSQPRRMTRFPANKRP
jgi:hypothetical protein